MVPGEGAGKKKVRGCDICGGGGGRAWGVKGADGGDGKGG